MKFLLAVFLCVSALAVKVPSSNRGLHPYEFVRNVIPKLNDLSAKAQQPQNQPKSINSNAGNKKSNGVPPYAVLMEPLIKYSPLDPLYNENKKQVGNLKIAESKSTEVNRVKKDQTGGENDIETQHISSKADLILPYGGSNINAFHHQPLKFSGDDSYYEAPYPQEPEPIIEIIIKESNQSLPAPPPPPSPKKKKKEPVQVFYVKYKKEPSSHYGEGKVIYDPPVPAITPPTNNDNSYHREDEEEDYSAHHYEDVTLPPKPSTTLKAIIRPDSETYQGSGIHITFGKPGSEESSIDSNYHSQKYRGDYEQQSAPQPSILLPPNPKLSPTFRINNEPQIKKRNPLPFQSPTPAPQQIYHNGPQFSTTSNYYKPTASPTFHQNQHFPSQSFKSLLPKYQPNNISPSQAPTASRQSSSFRYTTLPNFQSFSKPQPSFSFPSSPNQPSQQPLTQPQQLYSINQPHFKSSFQINSRSTPSQSYHTISNRVTQQPSNFQKNQIVSSSPPISHYQQSTKIFPQPTPSFPQSTPSFPPPPNSFRQPPNSFLSQGNSFSQPKFSQPISQSFFNGNQRNPGLQTSSAFDARPSPILPTKAHSQPFQQQQSQIQQHLPQQQQQYKQQQQHQHFQQLQLQQQQQEHLEQLKRLQHQQRLQTQTLQSLQQHHQTQIQQSIPFQSQLQNQKQSQSLLNHQQQPQQQNKNLLNQQLQHQNLLNQQQQQQNFINQQQQQQQNFINQQQQHLINQQQQQNLVNHQKTKSEYEPEIIKSISPDIPFLNHRFESKPQVSTTYTPSFSSTTKPNVQYNAPKNIQTTTESYKKYTTSKYSTNPTPPNIEYITEDPKKTEERKKQNVAALPKEVPDDLREQLLSSGILGNADIQILDYDKIGDIPIDKLPPEALANFQAVAGSQPVPAVALPEETEPIAEGSEQVNVAVRIPSDVMEMKVVRYNPESKEGSEVPQKYVKDGATQVDPVVLNDSKYNRYLPLKVSGAQFPVPDVPELRGKNVTSVVILAPVDYEFLQKHEDIIDESRSGRRTSHPVLEVQGVHFVSGDILKTLVKKPTHENYKLWLDKENKTSIDKQSVVLLVIDPKPNEPNQQKQIFMYDIGTQKVSKLSGELSAQFVEVAESNSENDDLDEISDTTGGSFTVKNSTPAAPHVRIQRKAIAMVPKKIRNVSSR